MKRAICKHLAAEPDRDGKVRFRAERAHRCAFPAPELPLLPISMTAAYGFRWPPERRWVTLDDCAKCPVMERRDER